jgi:hypothetical protein
LDLTISDKRKRIGDDPGKDIKPAVEFLKKTTKKQI